jgi:alpha-glucosidase
MKVCGKILEVHNYGDYLYVKTDGGQFMVYLLDSDTVRFRCTFEEKFAKERSYALVRTAWADELDGLLGNERTRVKPVPVVLEEKDGYWRIGTSSLEVRLCKEPFGIEIYNASGELLYEDLKERSFMEDSLGRRKHYSVIGDNDHFYGFGEKTGPLNKAKYSMRMHNTDACGHDAKLSDPLYKHIPFYIRFNDLTRRAVGIFYNNSFDSSFDMGRERSGYWSKYSYFCADGGDIDMFFINGPQISDVVRRYTDLTGKTALPPLTTTGYMSTTMFYTELEKDSDEAILDFIDTCKRNDIPIDGFLLASGYTSGKSKKRYAFNWNHDKFKDPAKFVADMKAKGAALVPNVKPGMLTSHPLFSEFEDSGAFIRDEQTGKADRERFWGGFAGFPDFTSEAGREKWKEHMKESLIAKGITGIWDDNNEFEIENADATVGGDGERRRVEGMRPVMPNMMAYTARQAIKESDPDTRPYVVSRAGFAGIQRYAQTWAGDNFTSWQTLRYNIPTILGMGLSGVANQGCDIGGWFGEAPEPELFVRWFQNGVFQPRFMTNSSNTDNTVTEPFMYPSYTSYISDAVKLRYRLIPTMYSLLRLASVQGDPVMRPLVYEFPDDPKCWDESFEFMFGSSLLVANVLDKGAQSIEVYLPQGAEWYELATYKRYAGGSTVTVPVALSSIPMFVRAGAIIPTCRSLTNIHLQKIEKLNILVEPSARGSFALYEDAGETNAYKNGEYLETALTVEPGMVATINAVHSGSYCSKVKTLEFDVVSACAAPLSVDVNGRALDKFTDTAKWDAADEGWYYDMESKQAHIRCLNSAEDFTVRVNYGIKDLIAM